MNPYDLLPVRARLAAMRDELQIYGAQAAVVTPDFRVFDAHDTRSIAVQLADSPATSSPGLLRCVIGLAADEERGHGAEAHPVVLIEVSDKAEGWLRAQDDRYDAVLRIPAPRVSWAVEDILLDLSISHCSHLDYIFSGFIAEHGFKALAREKADFVRHLSSTGTYYGPVAADCKYVTLASICRVGSRVDFGKLLRTWEQFAIYGQVATFARRSQAVRSLLSRKGIGGQLSPSRTEELIAGAGPGANCVFFFTPVTNTARDLQAEAGSAFGIPARGRNRCVLKGADDLFAEPYHKLQKKLVREKYVRIERVVISR